MSQIFHYNKKVWKDLNSQRSPWQKEEVTQVNCNNLYSCGSRPGILYGMVHKPVTDRCPSLRTILSTINTPSYKLAKSILPLLKPLTSSNYAIKDSFSFEDEVSSFDFAHYIISFDIFVVSIWILRKQIFKCYKF